MLETTDCEADSSKHETPVGSCNNNLTLLKLKGHIINDNSRLNEM